MGKSTKNRLGDGEYDSERIGAIRASIIMGGEIVDDRELSEMVLGMYCDCDGGKIPRSQEEIAKELLNDPRYEGRDPEHLRRGVHKALVGHDGKFGIGAYRGLLVHLSEEELGKLRHAHLRRGGVSSAVTSGRKPWTQEEFDELREMMESGNFASIIPGKYDAAKMTGELERRTGGKRTKSQVTYATWRIKNNRVTSGERA